MPTEFEKDTSELLGKDFYYSRRFAEGSFNVIKPHMHEYYELYYLTRGSRTYFIKNRIYTVGEGDIVLIKPNTIHYTASSRSLSHERILLNFAEKYISKDLKPYIGGLCEEGCITIPEGRRKYAENIFERLREEYESRDRYSELMEGKLLSELLITVLRAGTEYCTAYSVEENAESAVSGLLKYISENLSSEISLSDAAAYAGFSKSHFSKLFKEMTGFTFGEYLKLQRLLKAKRLLEKTSVSVTEVAYECGFENSGYFSTVFKAYFGMTPLGCRKAVR